MTKLYCLSGLGVDERAYKFINPKNIELVHIPWIPHLSGESLEEYAKRLFISAELPEDYNLIGVSFGGMIACEFAKIRSPKELILLSTIRGRNEMPLHFKLGGLFHFTKLFSSRQMKKANFITYQMFGIKEAKHKVLIQEILADTNAKFLKWAMHALTTWKNKDVINGFRIHGDKDKLIPISNNPPDYIIKDGGHFIIVTHAEEITSLIEGRITTQIDSHQH
ncbi:MAG: hypothetical protein ACPGVI_02495 [Crocinitomicaceae bacterium]